MPEKPRITLTLQIDGADLADLAPIFAAMSRVTASRREPTPPSAAEPIPAPAGDVQPAPRVKLAEHGSRYAAAMAEVDGNLVEIPACVAATLREIAAGHGAVAFREETRAKFPECLRWVLGMLRRDVKARVVNRRHVYVIEPGLPHLIQLVRDLEPAHG